MSESALRGDEVLEFKILASVGKGLPGTRRAYFGSVPLTVAPTHRYGMFLLQRGKFGTSLRLALLALTASSAVAEPLPPLRISYALLGFGTQPLSAPVASESTATIQPLAAVPLELTAPHAMSVDLTPPPAAPAAGSAMPVIKLAETIALPAEPAPVIRATESRRRNETTVIGPHAEAIQEPQAPPQVAERPALPPLYSAHVTAGEMPDPELSSTGSLIPYLKQSDESLPTFIVADQIAGKNDVEVVAEGNVELRKRNSILRSDRLTYWQETDETQAEGNVRLSRDGDRVSGPKMRMKMNDSTGFFEQPEYSIRRIKTGSAATLWTGDEERVSADLTTGYGEAKQMNFEGEGQYRLTDATYSTCTPVAGRDPDWFARTADLHLDYDDEVGTARSATVYFKGTPILYAPWLTFSLNHERKSGLLTPSFGTTSRGGIEYTQPFYWNIAPNMDATISPRLMSKRGTLWNGEYRYQQASYNGTMQGQYMPEDKVEKKSRSSYSLAHSQNLGHGFSATLAVNGASDDTFFSDLATGSAVVAQTNLLRQGTLSYGASWWSANLLAQSYQTLQDPSLPKVTEPYQRLPQLTVIANRSDLPLGLSFAFSGEHVSFRNQSLVEGRRFTLYPQISLPLQTEVLSLTPKLGFHSTRYTLDRRAAGTPDRLTRNVPIFSVDTSVTFERGLDWMGQSLTQTLEPRLYYLYVPVRDQSLIPVFDSGISDFNFAQMFGENRYAGGDRIGDANQVTAMITSRLLDPLTGAEIMRGAFGQRFYFSTQHVGLPGEVLRSDRQTDFLGAISGRIMPKTYVDTGIQYNPQLNRIDRLNLGGRYQPEPGKVLNAGYRYTRDQPGTPGLGQLDISGQWPVFGGWHAVGRFNYSTKDRRMVETVAGLEYDGGCWVGRVVMQRLATQTQESNTALFFQLELNGFARVGSSPLDILRRNVPGYGVINQQNPEGPFTIP